MDEEQVATLVQKSAFLKYKFRGVFAANNFPILRRNTFSIVNASPQHTMGTHWMLICNKNDYLIFADPLGFKLSSYIEVFKTISSQYNAVYENPKPIQPLSSNACGLYCVYLAHVVFSDIFPTVPNISELELFRFVNHIQ